MANERICIVCGSKYQYCSRCKGSEKQTWKNIYDTEDCMKLFNVCSAFKNNHIAKNDAAAQLKEINVPEQLNKHYQDIVDEITYVAPVVMRKDRRQKVRTKRIVNEDLN